MHWFIILLCQSTTTLTHRILLTVLARSVEGGKRKNMQDQKGQKISSLSFREAGGNYTNPR